MKNKKNTNLRRCAFCGRTEDEVPFLLTGIEACICCDCALEANRLVKKALGEDTYEAMGTHADDEKKDFSQTPQLDNVPKPREITAYLDQYIIGQDAAKRHLAVSVYNHYKRLAQKGQKGSHDADEVEIEKSNIIMVGSTGTGKTLIARTIARLLQVPFTIVGATGCTEAGYGGEDVESIRSRLLQVADFNVEAAQRGIVFIDEIDKIAR